jgi:hypothetical protein
MVAMLMREEDAVEFVRLDPTRLEAKDELARAQAAIDEQPTMIGRDQGAVPRAPAPEHCQTEHVRYLANRSPEHKRKRVFDIVPTLR